MDTVARVKELAREREISLMELSRLSRVPYSTIKDADRNRRELRVGTIEMICDGLGIPLYQFFMENPSSPERSG